MSLTNALSNALSGLAANSRAVGVVSSNLANLNTPGYGAREVELSAEARGGAGGVRVQTITRRMNQGLLADRRISDGALARAETGAAFFQRIETVVGTPDKPGSLGATIAAFEASLTTAASRPDETQRLDAVSRRAGDLVQAITRISGEIQAQRQSAEAEIERAVTTLNDSLAKVETLNRQIQQARRQGMDVSGLLDQRQVVVDRIAEIVPARETAKTDGAIGLITTGGAVLLDRKPAEIAFTRANAIVADMTLAGGGLSGLQLDGQGVATSGSPAPFEGGRLSALFAVRDESAVASQARVDAVARDLVERFQSTAVDPTLGPGDAGLFTDGGAAFLAGNEIGLSQRLGLNPTVDPTAGGASWRLRDGLGAVAPGAVGDASRLSAMRSALNARQPLSSAGVGGQADSLSGHAGSLVSDVAQKRLSLDETRAFTAARQAEFKSMLQADGVDSDVETQRLLLIEQAYAANARLIAAVDEMMQSLLRI